MNNKLLNDFHDSLKLFLLFHQLEIYLQSVSHHETFPTSTPLYDIYQYYHTENISIYHNKETNTLFQHPCPCTNFC